MRLRRPRLFVQLYLHGLALLFLAGMAAFVVGRYVLRPAVDGPTRPSTTWIAWNMAKLADQPATLARELESLKGGVGVEMTVYDGARLLGSNADPVPPPLSPRVRQRLVAGESTFDGATGWVVPDTPGTPRRYVLVRHTRQEFTWRLAALQLAVILIVLALVSIPLARSISAPVERLRQAARSFGSGDLSARAGLVRRDEIGELALAFDEMADRIGAFRRSERELLANVSHELRTPLARIRLAMELLTDGDANKAKAYLEDIDEDLGELEQLLDDVMTTARLDLAQGATGDAFPPLRLESIEAEGLLDAAALRFGKRHPERRLERSFDVACVQLEADPPLLRRVIDNLLDNAVKFSEQHELIELAARFESSASELIVEVRDRGIGIPPEDLDRVFTPFFRGDRSRARATGGVGLGLALVRRVVSAHRGTIRVESHVGSGSRFTLRLPARANAPSAAVSTDAALPGASAAVVR